MDTLTTARERIAANTALNCIAGSLLMKELSPEYLDFTVDAALDFRLEHGVELNRHMNFGALCGL